MADIFELFKKISSGESAKREPITHIVVGLGNPGDKYYLTRHNAGFLALDYISQKYSARVDRVKFKALCGEAVIGGKTVLLMKPQTFMNNSGEAVKEAASFYKIPLENIVVISDDVNLDVARLRVRRKGSDGGQKGMRSICEHLGSDAFPRIRIGVGQKPHPDYDMADWVLSEFNETEKKALFECFGRVSDGLERVLAGDVDGAMQICNSK
ncbi:MAG: aminoacyl-tRNA hydrolase [Clostridia bacterium]|nr:aminoacyl-tRNA hydrolase [Clostridia bacterium]MBP3369343.1 aminoacyl-tRNA hydrolase [Clostridia bacterium]